MTVEHDNVHRRKHKQKRKNKGKGRKVESLDQNNPGPFNGTFTPDQEEHCGDVGGRQQKGQRGQSHPRSEQVQSSPHSNITIQGPDVGWANAKQQRQHHHHHQPHHKQQQKPQQRNQNTCANASSFKTRFKALDHEKDIPRPNTSNAPFVHGVDGDGGDGGGGGTSCKALLNHEKEFPHLNSSTAPLVHGGGVRINSKKRRGHGGRRYNR